MYRSTQNAARDAASHGKGTRWRVKEDVSSEQAGEKCELRKVVVVSVRHYGFG